MHWSWFIVAIYSVSQRVPNYESPVWALGEYLALFVTVTLHEFGHALACRQVGGSANQIVLWPLGGVAYVTPPQRPGATLWSIAAGPLVNVVLLPVFIGAAWACGAAGLFEAMPDFARFMRALIVMDVSLLIFNVLPVYPLDGGQILRSLLWYPFGRARSLQIATIVGLVGGVALAGLALWEQRIWLGVIAFYLLSQSWQSYKAAGELVKFERLPRRPEFKCPVCHASPPVGALWLCASCRGAFDAFASAGVCPHCQAEQKETTCPDCLQRGEHRTWEAGVAEMRLRQD